MIRDLSNDVLNEALRRLRNELVKCDGTEGRTQARKNARRRALSSMRLLRAAFDREYPAIIERKEVVRRSPKARIKALRKAGWNEIHAGAAAYAAAGVPIKRVTWKDRSESPQPAKYVTGKGWVPQPSLFYDQDHEHVFVPGWATAIGPDNPTRLRQAKRSNVVKRAVLAGRALSLARTDAPRRPVARAHRTRRLSETLTISARSQAA